MTTAVTPAAVDDVRIDFGLFYLAMKPRYGYTYFQQAIIAPTLDCITAHEPSYRRVQLNLPFRYGKSDMCTRHFIPYYFAHNPEDHVMLLSYGYKLARTFGRSIRDLMSSPVYQELFPHIKLKRSSHAADEFELETGGTFHAGGFDTGINGLGCNQLIIDDYYKGKDQALSATIRERVRTIYKNTVETRLEPEAGILIVSTRWTPDDVCGWRLEEDGGFDHFTGQPLDGRETRQ